MSDVMTYDGRQIKMTYGLLNRLCRVVGEVDGAAVMTMDNDIRERVLIEILSPRDPQGNIPDGGEFNIFSITASTEEVSEVLDWAQEQVIDFFVKRAIKTASVTKLLSQTVNDLRATSTGGAS
jgi:hypothetical protein